jgi:hypothetical protein
MLLAGTTSSIRAGAEAADLGPVRAYIANARYAEFAIDGSASAWVEQRLVEARQADRDVGAKDFHTWLTVGLEEPTIWSGNRGFHVQGRVLHEWVSAILYLEVGLALPTCLYVPAERKE